MNIDTHVEPTTLMAECTKEIRLYLSATAEEWSDHSHSALLGPGIGDRATTVDGISHATDHKNGKGAPASRDYNL